MGLGKKKEDKKRRWYSAIGLEYARDDDPFFTVSEVKMLMGLYNDPNNYYFTEEAKEGLLNEELIECYSTEDGIFEKLTTKGDDLARDIRSRLNLPDIGLVIEFLIDKRKEKGITRKELSEKTSIEYHRLYTIENKPQVIYLTEVKKYKSVLNVTTKDIWDFIKLKGLEKSGFITHAKTFKEETNEEDLKNNNYKILISESPIETKLLKEIVNHKSKYIFNIDTQKDFLINDRNYRVDIYIEFNYQNKIHKVIIECDGHEYHEKTKEQAQKDKQRDRDFLSVGILTIRFTGSEIWKNAKGCAEEIFNTFNGYNSSKSV